jgi:uncharacterized membrane protein
VPRRPARGRDERGAAAIIVALASALLLLVAALAVDLGVQRVLRRDLQAMADVIALDMARHLDGSTHAVIKARESWRGQLEESVERNLNENPLPDVKAQQQQETAVLTAVGAPDLLATAVMGFIDDDTGEFDPVDWPQDNDAVPEAVQVTVTNARTFVFSGLTGIDKGGATRSAVAQAGTSACFKVGSFALGLATNDSILSAILGDAAAARVLSYDGLVAANVSLLDLAAELGVGTPDALLSAPNVTVGQLLDASAALLTEEGGTTNLEMATALGQIKTDLGPLVDDYVQFGELLSLGQGNNSALDAQINVLDLLTGGLIVANGVNAVSVPELNLNVLGTTLTAQLWITEAPKIACNDGIATTAQGYVRLSGTINLSVLGIGVRLTNVALTISLANASARLVNDGACTGDEITVEVFDQTLANVRLQATIQLVVLLVWANVGSIDTGAPPVDQGDAYVLPIPESYTDPVTTDSGTLGLNLTNASVTVAGLNVGALVAALAPLVNGVTSLLTGTLLPALGITTAGADLWAVPEPTCAQPALVG